MPAADTVLLPLCVGLTLIGVLVTAIAWRRGRRGRVVQGIGIALAPVALYFSGLLSLLWNAVVAIGRWAGRIVFSPGVWFGLSLLGVCLVLWVVGGLLARRAPARTKKAAAVAAGSGTNRPAVAGRPAAGVARPASEATRSAPKQSAKPATPIDDDMAEIEALLKRRGIE